MKNKSKRYSLIFIISFLLIFILANMGKLETDHINYENWILDWSDEFNDNKIDSTIWMVMPRRRDGGRNYITANDSCYSVSNGYLTIRAIKNTMDRTDSAKYLTGGIQTKTKKAFPPEGLLEVKARFNGVKGKTCAIWMLPFTLENGWPNDGEIDVMEHASSIKYITQTVHTSYTKIHPNIKPTRYIKKEINYKDFNVYGVEIEKDSLIYYVNGLKTMVYPRIDSLTSKGQYPFYRDWYLLLSTASRGPFDSICAPLEMDIDWVRYYSHKKSNP